jgi:hypothetical protein
MQMYIICFSMVYLCCCCMTVTMTMRRGRTIVKKEKEEEEERKGKEEEGLPSLLEQKIANATEGFNNHYINLLKKQSLKSNIETICDYIFAINAEVNPSLNHKRNQLQILCYLSEFCGNQTPFIKMTRNNIFSYLDSLHRPEESNPWHQWIGTYNLRRGDLLRFFKWLYYPQIKPVSRPIPDVVTSERCFSMYDNLYHC